MARPVDLTRWVPDDNSGVRKIVREHMIPAMVAASRHADIVTFANAFVRETQQQEAEALLYWTRGHMVYTPDPPNEELIKWPSVLMNEIRVHGQALGDCDDYVMLYATLLLARGIETRIVLIARQAVDDGSGQYQFDHIYVEALLDDEWTPIDPTSDQVALGWEHHPAYRKEAFDIHG